MHRLETGPPARNVTLRVWNWENYRDGERGRGVLVSGVCFKELLLGTPLRQGYGPARSGGWR